MERDLFPSLPPSLPSSLPPSLPPSSLPPSLPPSFLPSFLSSFLPSFLPSFIPSFLPSRVKVAARSELALDTAPPRKYLQNLGSILQVMGCQVSHTSQEALRVRLNVSRLAVEPLRSGDLQVCLGSFKELPAVCKSKLLYLFETYLGETTLAGNKQLADFGQ